MVSRNHTGPRLKRRRDPGRDAVEATTAGYRFQWFDRAYLDAAFRIAGVRRRKPHVGKPPPLPSWAWNGYLVQAPSKRQARKKLEQLLRRKLLGKMDIVRVEERTAA